MRYVTYNNHEYILSRTDHRLPNGSSVTELVDPQTGELVVLPNPAAPLVSPVCLKELDVVPGLIHFPSRPPEFLSKLRNQREEYLRQSRLKKRKERKLHKGPNEAKVSSPRKGRKTKASAALDAAAAGLPADIQALLKGSR